MAYDHFVVIRDLNFTKVREGTSIIIMGGSGCPQTALLRHRIGLMPPAKERYFTKVKASGYESSPYRDRLMRRFGVLYQSGALWSSMTLAENVSIPFEEYTDLNPGQIKELVSLKLSLVALAALKSSTPLR